ncbi:hypothetical protein IWQ60_012041 [Tieghemiomyces parasiticus]|uniref:Uncharacterized protein n=1 Tax=Tieghemiomyces parasiticus TaxID=78921 RepID=A0A9W7ZPE3_9FUNG|nr:hypothetical protein IWQ60_012041 [Tieghemiomyces parasiticus]
MQLVSLSFFLLLSLGAVQAQPTGLSQRRRTEQISEPEETSYGIPGGYVQTALTGDSHYPPQQPMVVSGPSTLKYCRDRVNRCAKTVAKNVGEGVQKCSDYYHQVADMDGEDWRDVCDEVCCETDALKQLVRVGVCCSLFCC